MCAKPWDVLTYIRQFENCDIELIHYDVMDGNFVPNIMLGTGEYKDIHEACDLKLDLHLMCQNPEDAFTYFDVRPGDRVSFHPQTVSDPSVLLNKIKEARASAGLALNPKTPFDDIEKFAEEIDFVLLMSVEPGFAGQKILPNAFSKIKEVYEYKQANDLGFDIMVDGNCSPDNVKEMIKNGANQFVVGSSVLNDKNKAVEFCKDYESYKSEIGI